MEAKNREAEEYNLKESRKRVGALVPVLKDASGNIIDGFHRLEADPSWPTVTVSEVKDKLGLIRARCVINVVRRRVPDSEKGGWVLEAAGEMRKAGMKVTEKSLADLFGMSRQWVSKYMPEEAKALLDEHARKTSRGMKEDLPRRGRLPAQPAPLSPPAAGPSPESQNIEGGDLTQKLGLKLPPQTMEDAVNNLVKILEYADEKGKEIDPPAEREKRRQLGLKTGLYMTFLQGLQKGLISCPKCGRHNLADLIWGCCHIPFEAGWKPIREMAHIGEF